MVVEIINKEDCVNGKGNTRHGHKRYNRLDFKYHRKDQIKKCFICGTRDPNRGCCWVEYMGNGRMERHFLCKGCRYNINEMMWIDDNEVIK